MSKRLRSPPPQPSKSRTLLCEFCRSPLESLQYCPQTGAQHVLDSASMLRSRHDAYDDDEEEDGFDDLFGPSARGATAGFSVALAAGASLSSTPATPPRKPPPAQARTPPRSRTPTRHSRATGAASPQPHLPAPPLVEGFGGPVLAPAPALPPFCEAAAATPPQLGGVGVVGGVGDHFVPHFLLPEPGMPGATVRVADPVLPEGLDAVAAPCPVAVVASEGHVRVATFTQDLDAAPVQQVRAACVSAPELPERVAPDGARFDSAAQANHLLQELEVPSTAPDDAQRDAGKRALDVSPGGGKRPRLMTVEELTLRLEACGFRTPSAAVAAYSEMRSTHGCAPLADVSPKLVQACVVGMVRGRAPPLRSAAELLAEREPARGVSCGSSKLDAALGGGLLPGQVVEVTGLPGTGKSQLCHALCANAPRRPAGGCAVYIDTGGCFSEEKVRALGGDAAKVVHMKVCGGVDGLLSELVRAHAYAEAHKTAVVVVDSLSSVVHAQHYRAPVASRSLACVYQLLRSLAGLGCVVAAVTHPAPAHPPLLSSVFSLSLTLSEDPTAAPGPTCGSLPVLITVRRSAVIPVCSLATALPVG